MTIGRRLRTYLIGVGLGLVVVFLLFNGRMWDWLPGNRVLILLQVSEIQVSDETACRLECMGLGAEEVRGILYKSKLNFSDSKTKGNPKTYELEKGNLRATFQLHTRDSVGVLSKITNGKQLNCGCNEKSKTPDRLLWLPERIIHKNLRTLSIVLTKKANCELSCAQLDTETMKRILRTGKLIQNESFPERRYAIRGESNGAHWTLQFTFPEDKDVINVAAVLPDEGETLSCPCDQAD